MPSWLAVPGGILLLAFVVFAFRQGMQVTSRQEGNPPERIDGGVNP
jgi:hypothetical protein